MLKTQATTFGTAIRAFPPRQAAVARSTPAFRNHDNDNRVGIRPHGTVPHAASRLVCRWRRDPATGRLVCHWELEGADALSAEPEQPRRAA